MTNTAVDVRDAMVALRERRMFSVDLPWIHRSYEVSRGGIGPRCPFCGNSWWPKRPRPSLRL
jgi:hypothetical protein